MGIFSKLFESKEDRALHEKLLARIPNLPISQKDYFHDIYELTRLIPLYLPYDASPFANILKQLHGSMNIETLYELTEAKEFLTQRREQIIREIETLEVKTATYLDNMTWYEDEAALSVFMRQRDMVDQRITNPWSTIYHYYLTYWNTRPLSIKKTKLSDAMRAAYSELRTQRPVCDMCINPEARTGYEQAHALWLLQKGCLEGMNVKVPDEAIVEGFRGIVTLIDSNAIRVRLRFDLAPHLPVRVSCESGRYVIHLPIGFLRDGSFDRHGHHISGVHISDIGKIALNGAMFGWLFCTLGACIENSASEDAAVYREVLRLADLADQEPSLSWEELDYLQASIGYDLFSPSSSFASTAEQRNAFLDACRTVGQEVRRLKVKGKLKDILANNKESSLLRIQPHAFTPSSFVLTDLLISKSVIDVI